MTQQDARNKANARGKNANTLFERERERDPEFRRQWRQHANRRAIAIVLSQLRHQAQLTQQELARRAGWRRDYVARLESPSGPQPSLNTLMRYAAACGAEAGLIFGHGEADHRFLLESGVRLAARWTEGIPERFEQVTIGSRAMEEPATLQPAETERGR